MERWKLTLAWGCLSVFFLLPIVLFSIHLHLGHSVEFAKEFRYVGEYLRTVAAIIISLAGFNTAEFFKQK
jgi:hypothetical protein